MFAAMAALLVAALCVPGAFGADALLFACAYAVVRVAHIMLFLLASRDDAALRHSVLGLAVSTAIGDGLLLIARVRRAAACSWDVGGGAGARHGRAVPVRCRGWRLVPGHFAERHGAIVIIALGESIVAIGVGAKASVDAGVVAAAVLGMVVAAALWWLYFDVVAIVAERRLRERRRGASRTRSRATPTPTCTSRWWRGSRWSRSG